MLTPTRYGPKPAEDTVEAFWSFPTFADLSTGAATPQGYELSFTNVRASVGGNGYMGLYTLKSYNTVTCAQICDRKAGCLGFNLYFERDPTVSPADACPNPPSFTNVKCTLWGNGVSEAAATNAGQYRGPEDANGDAFRVVITGSNGYNRKAPPAPIPNFTGPVQLGGAINAPLDNGYNTYMGVKFFKAPYDPAVCAAACQAQTAYNKRHAVDGKYRPCVSAPGREPRPCLPRTCHDRKEAGWLTRPVPLQNFFAAYVLSKNNVPEGMYCSMYTRSWDRSYATNQGQWRGTDYYSVSHAYSFTLSPLEPVNR